MKKLVFLAAALTLLAASLVGGVLREVRADDGSQALRAAALAERGLLLQERARRSGDPALYPAAERELREALRLDPRNAEALLGLAALAGSRHRFDEMLVLARRAQDVAPKLAAVHGLLGDALLELGRYREAFVQFDRLARLKPSAAAYARVSYARELRGDLPGALAALELAIDSAAQGEPSALMRTLAGNLLLADGRPGAASVRYREALALAPGHPAALAGLADVALAQGRSGAALTLLRRASSESSTPEFSASLAGLLDSLGRADEAARAWERADALERRFAANGGDNRLETAELDLARDRNVVDALARARAGRAARPSVEGDHVLAWALYKNGLCAEARRVSLRSLRLGTLDVDGLYHHALIARCLGRQAEAERYLARVEALAPRYLDAPPSAKRLTP
jgi:tetratricopeptide (TPR) repeat protein